MGAYEYCDEAWDMIKEMVAEEPKSNIIVFPGKR